MSVQKTAVGTCEEVSERGEWTTFHVNVGTQYPLKLATKQSAVAELGRAAARDGGTFTWHYNETESEKINEHTGKPFVNRYLSKVEQAEIAPAKPASSRTDAMTKDEWARKDSAIHLMACIKTAAEALKHTLPADPELEDLNKFDARVATLSYRWHRYVIAQRDDPADDDIPF